MPVLAVTAIGGWWWYGGQDPALPPWQAERFLPADADVAVWSAPIGEVADQLGVLGSQVPGLRGVFDLVKLYVGVDLRDAEATARAGLRRDAGLTVCIWRNGVWLAVPIRSPAGAAHIAENLRRRGYGIGPSQAHSSGQSWQIDDRQGGVNRARVWQLSDSVVVRVALDATPTGNAVGAIDTLVASKPRTDMDLAGAAIRAETAWGLQTPQAKLIQGQLHKLLGPADLAIGAAVDLVHSAGVRLDIGAERTSLTVKCRTEPNKLKDIADFHQNFVLAGGELAIADLLPDETPLLLRARINPALWNNVPEFLRERVVPTSALTLLHSSLSAVDARQILAQWDGQIAVALLAIGDQVPLDPNGWRNLWWRTALRLAVAVSFKTDTLAADVVTKLAAAIDTSAERTQVAQFGAWTGFSVPGPESPLFVLRKGKHVAMVAGTAAGDDLRRVVEGKFEALAKVARDGTDREIVDGKATWLGARVNTPRLVRSLRRRGVPDYAVQLVGAIEIVDARVQLGPSELVLELVLQPSGHAAGVDKAVSGAGDSP